MHCSVPDCTEEYHAKGFCGRHYRQMQRHGKILKRTRREPNEIIIKENYALVILRSHKNQITGKAKIDLADVELVKKYKWCSKIGYVWNDEVGFMHRFLTGVEDEKLIDHRNHKTSDNRRRNLRRCKHKNNMRNRQMQVNNTSGVKGVIWSISAGKWTARIRITSKRIHLGYFQNIVNAALVYNKAAIKYHKEFATVNDIDKLKAKLLREHLIANL